MSLISLIDAINKDLNLSIPRTCINSAQDDSNKYDLLEKNLLIAGDNLLSLSMLVESGRQFKVAYIDPPYNTGNKFVYRDKLTSEYNPIWNYSKSWVEYIAVRLILLRSLVTQDGYIAFSIDDREFANLLKVADYVFGIDKRIPTIVVKKNNHGKGSSSDIANQHEYIVIYKISDKSEIGEISESRRSHKEYNKEDERGQFRLNGLFRKKGKDSLRAERPNMFYPLYYDSEGKVYTQFSIGLKPALPIDSSGIERRWLWGLEKSSAESYMLYASEKGVIYVKDYYQENKSVMPRSIWEAPDYFTQNGTLELKNDLGEEGIFETPKSIELMKDLLSLFDLKDHDSVLDVFSGSGSFAIAAKMKSVDLNIDLGIVCLETDEAIDHNHTASRMGYEKIYEITEKRIASYIPNIHTLRLSARMQEDDMEKATV